MSADQLALFSAELQKLEQQKLDAALAAQSGVTSGALRKELLPLLEGVRSVFGAVGGLSASVSVILAQSSTLTVQVRELQKNVRELRALFPERIAAREAARKEALRYNFISCLILTAQNGFGRDVYPFVALCRETYGEEQLWAAIKDLPHGRVRREGPATRFEPPFGFERGPFSAGRTHLMYAAQAGDVPRLTWLLARGALVELKDWLGRTALHWAAREGRVATLRELLARGAAVDAVASGNISTRYASQRRFYDNELVGGLTPLHIACLYGHVEVVRELIARGARPGVVASNGASAHSIATLNRNAAILQLLNAAGAAP